MTRYSLLSDNNYHNGAISRASSSISITDIGTFRARAGYALGSFLPYDVRRSGARAGRYRANGLYAGLRMLAGPGSTTAAHLLGTQLNRSVKDGKYSHLIYGYTAGLGVDMNLVGGLFVRAEWEYIRFTSSVDTIDQYRARGHRLQVLMVRQAVFLHATVTATCLLLTCLDR